MRMRIRLLSSYSMYGYSRRKSLALDRLLAYHVWGNEKFTLREFLHDSHELNSVKIGKVSFTDEILIE